MAAVGIAGKDLMARELRAASAKACDARAARRMLAIALVLEGKDPKTAAETCGMDRQTLRDWVHRYNAKGFASREIDELTVAGPAPIWSHGKAPRMQARTAPFRTRRSPQDTSGRLPPARWG